MRVVGGIAGGRTLRAPPGRRIRPTSERVREAVFSSLTSMSVVDGAAVIDLFAGTGALGIEALSRGATSATFVEADPAALAAIEANLTSTGLAGGRVIRSDAMRFLKSSDQRFDVAFADPPYSFDDWPHLLEALMADVAVLESRSPLELGEKWSSIRERQYGGTVVTIARRSTGSDDAATSARH